MKKYIIDIIAYLILFAIYGIAGYLIGYNHGYKQSQKDYINYINNTLLENLDQN